MAENGTKPTMIYKRIAHVMAELKPISKAKHNETQEFDYRGIDDVMNGIQPMLVKHQIFAIPEVLEFSCGNQNARGGGGLLHSTVKMRFTFYTSDGSNVVAVVCGEGMDTGDKSLTKAQSIAYRVALCQVFFIPTADAVIDPDKDSYLLAAAGGSAGHAPTTQHQQQKQRKISNWTAIKSAIVGTGYTIEKAIELAKSRHNIERLNNLNAEQLTDMINYIKQSGAATKTTPQEKDN